MTRTIDTPGEGVPRHRSFAANWIPGAAESRSLRRRLMAVLRLSCRILGPDRKRHPGVLGGNGGARELAVADLAGADARRPVPVMSWAASAILAVAALAGSAPSASATTATEHTIVSGGNNNGNGANAAKLTDNDACATLFGRGNPGTPQNFPFGGATIEESACGTAVGSGAEANPTGATALGSEATASGNVSIAIGALSRATATSTVAIGAAAQALGVSSLAMGRESVSEGVNSMALGPVSYAKSNGAVAIGASAFAENTRAIAIGGTPGVDDAGGESPNWNEDEQTKAGGAFSIALGTRARTASVGEADEDGAANGIAIGTDAQANADNAISIGTKNEASGLKAISIGSDNKASGEQSISIGTENTVSGKNSGAIGDPTTISGTGSYSLGNDNTIAADDAGTFGNQNTLTEAADGSRIVGNGNDVDVPDAFVLGNAADVTVAGGVALGSASVSDTGAVDGYVPGIGATAVNKAAIDATKATHGAVAVGNATGEESVFRQVTGVAAGTADSDAVNVAQLKSVETIAKTGWNLSAEGLNASNVGPGETVDLNSTDNNIVVSKAADSDDVTFDLADDITVNKVTAGNSVLDTNGLTITGGPKVLSTGIDAGGKKITNLAAGALTATSTDAVNGSQLFATDSRLSNLGTNTAAALGGGAVYNAVTGEWTTAPSYVLGTTGTFDNVGDALAAVNSKASAGWKLKAAGANESNVEPGEAVDLKSADSNIVVSKSDDSDDVTFDLADALTVDKVTAGNSLLDTNGLTVNDGTNSTSYGANGFTIIGGPKVTSAGIDAGGKAITNVAPGVNGTDAATIAQLNAVATGSGNTDQRAVKYDWNDADSDGVVDEGEVDLASVTLAGGEGGTKITNLAAGALSATSTDAVNGSQLFATDSRLSNLGTNTAAALGGGAVYDPVKDEWTAPSYDVGTGTFDNVGDALAAVDSKASAGWNLSAEGKNASNVGPDETVDLNSGDNNIVVSKKPDSDSVTFDLADDITVKTVAAGNSLLDTNGLTVNDGTNSTSYGANGFTIIDGPKVTSAGIDAGGKAITNVAPGVNGTDAATIAQLNAVATETGNTDQRAVKYDWNDADSDGVVDDGEVDLTSVTLAGGEGGTKITNLAAGELSATSTDAVNGSQLYETNVKVGQLGNQVNEIDGRVTTLEGFKDDVENAVVYDTDPAGKRLNTLSLKGGDPNKPVLVANVAKGKKDTDAANVGQLKEGIAESKHYTDERSDRAIKQSASYTDQVVQTRFTEANSYTDRRFSQLSGEIGAVRGEARQAAAIGLAAASLRFDDQPGKLSVAFGGGFWRSEGALAFGAGYTSEDGRVRANLTGTAAGGHLGAGAGLSITLN